MLPELVRRARPAVLIVARKEQQMTTALRTYGSGTVMPAEAIHVTGRRVVATLIDGLFVIGYYVLLEGYLGQTVGKVATGIKVVSEATGTTPGIAAAARLATPLVTPLVMAAWCT